MRPSLLTGCFAALLVAALPGAAAAQSQALRETSLTIGPTNFVGIGRGVVANLGLASRLGTGVFLIEPSFGFFSYLSQQGHRRNWIFPDLTIQVEALAGSVRPYLGGGLGAAFEARSGPSHLYVTLLGVGGVRLRFGGPWGARAEVRLRSIDPFNYRTLDICVGITRGFL